MPETLDRPKTLTPNDALVTLNTSTTWLKESENAWYFVKGLGVSPKGCSGFNVAFGIGFIEVDIRQIRSYS